MFSGQVFTPLILWTLLNPCTLSTVDIQIVPSEPVDYGNGSANVTFVVHYNVTESGKYVGIAISMGPEEVADCLQPFGFVFRRPGSGFSLVDLPPNDCSSLPGPGYVPISSGTLKFGITVSNTIMSFRSIHSWSAGLLDDRGDVRVRSTTLNITVGDLRKTATVTIEWSADVPVMVFKCSIGEVQPSVDLVLTVAGVTSARIQTPGIAELQIPHSDSLTGGNFLCAVDVVYPVPKSLTDSFRIEYAPVFQTDPDPVSCQHVSCQVTLNCSNHGVLAYPAATLTWPQLNSTDGVVLVSGPGVYICKATNVRGTDTVVYRVVEEAPEGCSYTAFYVVSGVQGAVILLLMILFGYKFRMDILGFISKTDPGYDIPLRPTVHPGKQSNTTKKCAGGTGKITADLNNQRVQTSPQTMDETTTAEDYMTPVSSQRKTMAIPDQYVEIGAKHEEPPNTYAKLNFAHDSTYEGPSFYDEVGISDNLHDQGVTKSYENVNL